MNWLPKVLFNMSCLLFTSPFHPDPQSPALRGCPNTDHVTWPTRRTHGGPGALRTRAWGCRSVHWVWTCKRRRCSAKPCWGESLCDVAAAVRRSSSRFSPQVLWRAWQSRTQAVGTPVACTSARIWGGGSWRANDIEQNISASGCTRRWRRWAPSR